MSTQANTANTEDWLEATKDMDIKAYVEPLKFDDVKLHQSIARDDSPTRFKEFDVEYPPISLEVDCDITFRMPPREIRTIELDVTVIRKARPRLYASDWEEAAAQVLRDRADAWQRLAE